MRIDALFYRLAYHSGRPRWDTTQPRPELVELTHGRPAGRALDLGCGTGTDCIYLADQGWEALGVDFAPKAIAIARSRAAASGSSASFTVGDVTRLREAGVHGEFDLVIDIGCYHAIPAGLRDSYVTEVAAVTKPGADFYLAGVADPPATWRLLGARGVNTDDLRDRFGAQFELVDERNAAPAGRAGSFALYHLVRQHPSRLGRRPATDPADTPLGAGTYPGVTMRSQTASTSSTSSTWAAGASDSRPVTSS
jgi:SAM-dependent methyltransferase